MFKVVQGFHSDTLGNDTIAHFITLEDEQGRRWERSVDPDAPAEAYMIEPILDDVGIGSGEAFMDLGEVEMEARKATAAWCFRSFTEGWLDQTVSDLTQRALAFYEGYMARVREGKIPASVT